MKKIIILALSILISVCTFAQLEIETYPKILTDSIGNKTMVFTLEQVRIIDNKLDILELLEKTNNLNTDMDSVCITVINEKNEIISKQDIQINNLTESNTLKAEQIENLNKQISDYITNEVLYDKQLKNKDEEIQLNIDKMNDLKKKTIIGGVVGGGVIIGLVILLISI